MTISKWTPTLGTPFWHTHPTSPFSEVGISRTCIALTTSAWIWGTTRMPAIGSRIQLVVSYRSPRQGLATGRWVRTPTLQATCANPSICGCREQICLQNFVVWVKINGHSPAVTPPNFGVNASKGKARSISRCVSKHALDYDNRLRISSAWGPSFAAILLQMTPSRDQPACWDLPITTTTSGQEAMAAPGQNRFLASDPIRTMACAPCSTLMVSRDWNTPRDFDRRSAVRPEMPWGCFRDSVVPRRRLWKVWLLGPTGKLALLIMPKGSQR